jgi:hypothetical protein
MEKSKKEKEKERRHRLGRPLWIVAMRRSL